jgi:hypothetical protein
MEDIVARLRCNDPSLVQCQIDLQNGACPQILEALQGNTCVKGVVITFPSFLVRSRGIQDWDPNLMANFVEDLVQFLRTTEHVRTVVFHHFSPQVLKFVPLLLNSVTKNPRIEGLKFHSDIKLSTEKIVGILQMSSLCRLTLSLHSALDSQLMAAAFGVNTRLEYLALLETEDFSVVEAVLPRLSAIPSLSELVVFGGKLRERELPDDAPPTYVAAVGHTLGAATSLTQVSLVAFLFRSENIAALLSGLEANQSVSTFRMHFCWFSNDGCGETFATFMKSVSVTNPALKHLDFQGCEIRGCRVSGPFLPAMVVQAPLQVLEMEYHIGPLCKAWVSDPESVTLQGLILRQLSHSEWATLVQSLPRMKSLRQLTVTQLSWSCTADLFVQHMRNHWNLQTVVLHRVDATFLDERQQCLVNAFSMRNDRVPAMLANPMMPGDDVCRSADGLSAIQDQEGKVTLALFPSLFQTAQRTKSKSPHMLFLGLLSAQDAIESSKRYKKRQAT